ncbi:MAG: siroheme synthase CysG [Pseudomonadota bacterium]
MQNYPLFINLRQRRVTLVGGGELALRKARLLRAAEATLHLMAPDFEPGLCRELADDIAAGTVVLHQRHPRAEDFVGQPIAVVALEDRTEQEEAARLAKADGALVNVVDAPDLCDFTTPSIIDRGDVVVAISTNGVAPVYGRMLREKIEAMLPRRLDALIQFAARFRDSVRGRFGSETRRFWERFFDGPIAGRVLAGDDHGAVEDMLQAVKTDVADSAGPGENIDRRLGVVHIVGAGPGDPDLLTLRAHRLLQTADVLVHDRLVSDEILNLARRDADRIFVGKEKANHAVPQEQIHILMIELARAGKTVVRLKGGDPFIFGRGGEELDALRAANIPAFVTPGITAATGCAAAAGMALTHRDHAQMLTFVTGHGRADADPDINWRALSDLQHTLVIYMGVSKAGRIAHNLIDHGTRPETPVAIIENGSRPEEIIARGSLATITETLAAAGIKGPAILVVGSVATLADGAVRTIATQEGNDHSPSEPMRLSA